MAKLVPILILNVNVSRERITVVGEHEFFKAEEGGNASFVVGAMIEEVLYSLEIVTVGDNREEGLNNQDELELRGTRSKAVGIEEADSVVSVMYVIGKSGK